MSDPAPQSFANHARFVPIYHFATAGVLAASLLYSAYMLISPLIAGQFNLGMLIMLGFVLAVIAVFFFSRIFALGVQDRLIRLEERLRMERLLGDDLKSRLDELEKGQWIALRFASDDELPGLVKDALDNKTASKDIKAKIQNWRADHWRI